MEKNQPTYHERCNLPPLSSYPVLYPSTSHICYKSFKNAIDFHPKDNPPCKSPWYRDIVHVRNRKLLDLPYKIPKCCSDIYNMVMDRQKLKKVRKYGLNRHVRAIVSTLEVEEGSSCVSEPYIVEKVKATYFPECYTVEETSSSDEEEEEVKEDYKVCSSGSISECSGCSTLGGGKKSKIHKMPHKNFRDLLHSPEEFCMNTVKKIMKKHKLGRDFTLKLKKVF